MFQKEKIVDLILSSLSQGLLWSIMAIGVYLTYRILDIADLTAEGAYPLGAAICATGIVSGLLLFWLSLEEWEPAWYLVFFIPR